ncbi:zinc finger matrin-type protein CG9776 [Amyelois transitella]|uniref:zinc finger matrin-type protein CG9776 n=1 Tax=Amyelois transitella TaxID=680683 RepID=UPI00298F7EC6|nr:zinc finger matrin-type protein CG9776 [Amyelois transitella]
MSRDPRDPRNKYLSSRERDRVRDHRDRPPIWGRSDYHRGRPPPPRKRTRSRSPPTRELEKRRSRSPRKSDKDLDENILSEISKLPEPSELWDNQNQFGDGFGAPPAPGNFPREGVQPNPFNPNYQPSYSGIYDDFPPVASLPQTSHPGDMASWNQMSLPPAPGPPVFVPNVEDQIKKEAAIESEMRHQKAALSKQREDYIKKAGILKKELDTLKDQRNELRGDAKRSPSPDTKRFLKENTKLQLEIQNKLKTINNVVDMLNGIIGEEAHAHEVHDSDDSDHGSKRKSRSPSNHKFNYVYYDPEMHWCRVCNEFPPTAKDYLNHLHSPAHHKMAAAHMEAPWHSVTGVNEGFPSLPSAPTKRTPIRGLQFFVPSTAWYCKLCDQFIGDLHCASAHLKSIVHSKNYQNFVEQNPHWETDWVSDRQKAFEKSRAHKKDTEKPQQYTAHTITFSKDGFHTKSKDLPSEDDRKRKKDKKKKMKKKASSSSSSSESSSSESDSKKKKSKAKKPKVKGELKEKALSEFMSAIQMEILNDNDRKLLNNIKSRMKNEKEKKEEKRERSVSVSTRKIRSPARRSRSPRARRSPRRRDASPARDKKPEIKKMPFIGKMPVYKNLVKNAKNEEQKKDEQKKKDEEEEASKKRREEMDAEIQKKVAEFKEKIAKAQRGRQQQLEMPPPALALPTALGAAPPALLPPAAAHAPPTLAPTPQPSLPKDLQEALDIIFPNDGKTDLTQVSQDILAAMPAIPPGFPLGMSPFPSLPLMQPQIPGMFGFELNPPMFPPRPQLYDTHVPLVPSKPRPKHNRNKNHEPKVQKHTPQKTEEKNDKAKNDAEAKSAKIKEELDDLAMLGIDASDVGAGM